MQSFSDFQRSKEISGDGENGGYSIEDFCTWQEIKNNLPNGGSKNWYQFFVKPQYGDFLAKNLPSFPLFPVTPVSSTAQRVVLLDQIPMPFYKSDKLAMLFCFSPSQKKIIYRICTIDKNRFNTWEIPEEDVEVFENILTAALYKHLKPYLDSLKNQHNLNIDI